MFKEEFVDRAWARLTNLYSFGLWLQFFLEKEIWMKTGKFYLLILIFRKGSMLSRFSIKVRFAFSIDFLFRVGQLVYIGKVVYLFMDGIPRLFFLWALFSSHSFLGIPFLSTMCG